jgi:hypothetical protein
MSRRHLRKPLQSSFLFSALIIVASATSWARQKIDVLIMNNGDHITCEIVRVEKGYLFVKLPYGDGTVSLDWSKVVSVESPQQFVFTDQNGRRYSGTLQKLAVKAEQSEEQVPNERAAVADIKKVVEIQPYNAGFWRNQHGSIDFGLSFAKQSSRTQYSLTANDAYIRQKWSVRGDFASSLATGGGSDTRNDVIFTGARQLYSPLNVAIGYTEFLQSNEQNLNLRTTLGGGLGHFFRYTNSTRILALAGLVLDKEQYAATAQAGHNGDSLEAMIGAQANFFRFKKMNLLGTAQLYPSITDAGRVRLDINALSRLRIAHDLDWNTTFYLNYDSRPPLATPQSDYGLSSGFGWSF